MNCTLSKLFTFAAGAAIGSVATWYFVKTKYERIAQAEIDSVIEVFSKKNGEPTEGEDTETKTSDEEERAYYTDILTEAGYSDKETVEKEKYLPRPYVIANTEYGDQEGYDEISLTLYADGVLTDDMNELVEDVDNVVGLDSLNHFGEYEEDAVHVRNDRLKADYEILAVVDKYSDVINSGHHLTEGE